MHRLRPSAAFATSSRLYAKTHEWVERLDSRMAKVGITDYAQRAMGDLVYADLPKESAFLQKNGTERHATF